MLNLMTVLRRFIAMDSFCIFLHISKRASGPTTLVELKIETVDAIVKIHKEKRPFFLL